MNRLVVAIPTYNERDTIISAIERTRKSVPDADIVVIDDGSPDGTGQLVEDYATNDSHVSVLHRVAKEGLGKAYIAGIARALDAGYDLFATMDADGSHHPEALVELLRTIDDGADVAVGSRWMPGGKTENWPWYRRLLSRGGTLYTNMWLHTGIRDVTGGFRIYRLAAIRDWDFATFNSAGYCFQVEMAWRAVRDGLTVREIPITFTERVNGVSKMSGGIIREAMLQVTKWGLATLFGRLPAEPKSAVPTE